MVNNEELISVIVPIYRVEQYLRKCIDSILNQTYNNIEIILVDDGSPDNCGKICDEYAKRDSRIRVIHKENGGLSDARNTGIDACKGNYITFVDSDDYIENDYVETLYYLLKKYNTEIAICDCRIIKDNKKKKEKNNKISEYCITSKDSISKMLYSDFYFITANAKIYNKELFKDIKFPKGKVFEDVGTTYKLILKCKNIACSNKKIYNYLIRKGSITTEEFKNKQLDLISITEKMCDEILKIYPEMTDATLRRKIYANISTLNRILLSKKEIKETKEIIKYIRQNGKKVIKDKNVCYRDKIAIQLILCNIKLYKMFLFIYKK